MFERLSAKAMVVASGAVALCGMTFAGVALLGYAVFAALDLVLIAPLAAAAASAILLLVPAGVVGAFAMRGRKKAGAEPKSGIRLAGLASFLGEPSIAKAALSGLAMRRPLIVLAVAVLVAFLRIDMRQPESDAQSPPATA